MAKKKKEDQKVSNYFNLEHIFDNVYSYDTSYEDAKSERRSQNSKKMRSVSGVLQLDNKKCFTKSGEFKKEIKSFIANYSGHISNVMVDRIELAFATRTENLLEQITADIKSLGKYLAIGHSYTLLGDEELSDTTVTFHINNMNSDSLDCEFLKSDS